jgi:hypothetical protein
MVKDQSRNLMADLAARSSLVISGTDLDNKLLSIETMSDLRNPNLRIRDIRKLVALKSQLIEWDQGCDKSSEWVLASIANDRYLDRLMSWLRSKNVAQGNECLMTNNAWHEPRTIRWHDLFDHPLDFFGGDGFQLYDIDLEWVLEYAAQEVARFGNFTPARNA